MTTFKVKFNRLLEPVKVMLIDKKGKLDASAWDAFVKRTKDSILRCPDQYLGRDLPPSEDLRIIVDEIFDEFVRRAHSLEVHN